MRCSILGRHFVVNTVWDSNSRAAHHSPLTRRTSTLCHTVPEAHINVQYKLPYFTTALCIYINFQFWVSADGEAFAGEVELRRSSLGLQLTATVSVAVLLTRHSFPHSHSSSLTHSLTHSLTQWLGTRHSAPTHPRTQRHTQ